MTSNEAFRSEFGDSAFIELMYVFSTGDTETLKCLSIGHTGPLSKDVFLLMGDIYIHAYYTLSATSTDDINRSSYNIEILEYGREITMPLGPSFDNHRRNMRINVIITE